MISLEDKVYYNIFKIKYMIYILGGSEQGAVHLWVKDIKTSMQLIFCSNRSQKQYFSKFNINCSHLEKLKHRFLDSIQVSSSEIQPYNQQRPKWY